MIIALSAFLLTNPPENIHKPPEKETIKTDKTNQRKDNGVSEVYNGRIFTYIESLDINGFMDYAKKYNLFLENGKRNAVFKLTITDGNVTRIEHKYRP